MGLSDKMSTMLNLYYLLLEKIDSYIAHHIGKKAKYTMRNILCKIFPYSVDSLILLHRSNQSIKPMTVMTTDCCCGFQAH